MKLTEVLADAGITKAELADRLGVNRKTVTRMGEEVSAEVMQVIQAVRKNPDDYTLDEIRAICKRRGGIESDHNRKLETDFEIAHSLGLKVWQFNQMIDRLRKDRVRS